MTLADVLSKLNIDVKNLDNEMELKLYKPLYLKNIDDDGMILHPLDVEIDEDNDIVITF